jgi:hypothetical protein
LADVSAEVIAEVNRTLACAAGGLVLVGIALVASRRALVASVFVAIIGGAIAAAALVVYERLLPVDLLADTFPIAVAVVACLSGASAIWATLRFHSATRRVATANAEGSGASGP